MKTLTVIACCAAMFASGMVVGSFQREWPSNIKASGSVSWEVKDLGDRGAYLQLYQHNDKLCWMEMDAVAMSRLRAALLPGRNL